MGLKLSRGGGGAISMKSEVIGSNHVTVLISTYNSDRFLQQLDSLYGRWCMNKVICNQCVTPFIYDVFSKKRLFFIKNHQSNKYNPLIYLYFIHAPTPFVCTTYLF